MLLPVDPAGRAESEMASIEVLLKELQAGRPIIVVDDDDRENEGDIIIPAEKATEALLAFTIRYTGGVVCLAMPDSLADHLELAPMVEHNTAPLKTAYTVSIEAKRGVTTGISAKDRATTIRATVAPGVSAADLTRPGHVFPLRARLHGVLERRGHTEAAVDLCRLAGLAPVGAISELMHDDGTMMRLPAILAFARQHELKVGTIAELVEYRLERESYVRPIARAKLPTQLAEFDIHGFRDELEGSEHVALTLGDVAAGGPVLVHLHVECVTGDLLGSLHCDCASRRTAALDLIAREGRGVLVYLRRPKRSVQPAIRSTHDEGGASHAPDLRDAATGAQMLRSLGVHSIRLMTNRAEDAAALGALGLPVVDRVPLQVG